MKYNFDTLVDRRSTESGKWGYFEPDVLPMWVADMDFVSPEPVIRALQKRVKHGVFGYPSFKSKLNEVVANHLQNKYHWTVSPDDILLIPGVVVGFFRAAQAFTGPGTGVMFQTPVYHPFFMAPDLARASTQTMELTYLPDGHYEIDFDAFEAAITDETHMFLLCNPHNPVGRVFRMDELQRMAEICMRHNVIICSDEIHCDLIFRGQQHIPIATLDAEIAQKTITLMAPSKTYNIAGLEVSAAIIQNKDVKKQFVEAARGLVGFPNLLGQVAALAAYQEGQPWLDELLVYLEANRDFLYDYVRSELPGIKMAKPEGTYLAWLDCRESGIEGNPQKFFMQNARVAFNNGEEFGLGGQGFVRLNFGCPRSMLADCLERMKQALDKLNG